MVEKEFEMPWYVLTVYNLPLIIIQFILIFMFYKIYKPTKYLKNGVQYFQEEYAKLGKLSVKEKKAIFLTCLLFLYIILFPLFATQMLVAASPTTFRAVTSISLGRLIARIRL